MKWLAVVDQDKRISEGRVPTITRFAYELIRRTRARVDPLQLRADLEKAKVEGQLMTRIDPWEFCSRFSFPWLKEKGYVVTDVPYVPRNDQRRPENKLDPLYEVWLGTIQAQVEERLRKQEEEHGKI